MQFKPQPVKAFGAAIQMFGLPNDKSPSHELSRIYQFCNFKNIFLFDSCKQSLI
jgi:hypothetical protein